MENYSDMFEKNIFRNRNYLKEIIYLCCQYYNISFVYNRIKGGSRYSRGMFLLWQIS
jgi:hypothetical protein